jgi:molecular chaperone IbpA
MPIARAKTLEIKIRETQMLCAVARTGPLTHAKRRSRVLPRVKRQNCCSMENRTMRHVDFSPLYRSTVGFDRLFTMLDSLGQPDSGQTYPPYNIERTGDDAYRISMAVAGFSDSEIDIVSHRNVLIIKGERKEEKKEDGSEVIYRGIAARSFERRFQLADHVEVTGAALKNGLLHIELKRSVPEELKPRKIEITGGKDNAKQIEAKAA